MTAFGALPTELWLVVAVLVLVALAGGFAAALWGARSLDRWRRVSRARHAIRGEARARQLLEHRGFEIEGAQVECEYSYACDGARVRAGLRADFVVLQGRKRYVAEVKTGSIATSLQHAPTRRQLLEYQYAFETDGVLFIDADTERIHRVEF